MSPTTYPDARREIGTRYAQRLTAKLTDVDVLIGIGEFSKMTYLSVKALRHYHEVGLLEPADIDPATGYRRYSTAQVATAQAIRRFRDLEMPIDEVRVVLATDDPAERNRAIIAHLERMQRQLDETRSAVDSLHALLSGPPHPKGTVEVRRLPVTTVLAARSNVGADCGPFLERAYAELHEHADRLGLTVDDADSALYSDEFFEEEGGEVVALVPIELPSDIDSIAQQLPATIELIDLPAQTVAVLVHDGPFSELDQAYAALGTIVAERGIGGPGPIREIYLTPTRTEVCWPVTTGDM